MQPKQRLVKLCVTLLYLTTASANSDTSAPTIRGRFKSLDANKTGAQKGPCLLHLTQQLLKTEMKLLRFRALGILCIGTTKRPRQQQAR